MPIVPGISYSVVGAWMRPDAVHAQPSSTRDLSGARRGSLRQTSGLADALPETCLRPSHLALTRCVRIACTTDILEAQLSPQ
jgi:hypothetical protein